MHQQLCNINLGHSMPRFRYIVLSRCATGQEAEFESWYCGRHMADVCKVEGVVSAKLSRICLQKVYDLEAPQWGYITEYELEADDPQDVIDGILAVSGTDAMPLSPALDKEGMVQVIGEPIGAYP